MTKEKPCRPRQAARLSYLLDLPLAGTDLLDHCTARTSGYTHSLAGMLISIVRPRLCMSTAFIRVSECVSKQTV